MQSAPPIPEKFPDMTTLSPRELADSLVARFDSGQRFVWIVPLSNCCVRWIGALWASDRAWKVEDAVLRLLEERPPEDLPFVYAMKANVSSEKHASVLATTRKRFLLEMQRDCRTTFSRRS